MSPDDERNDIGGLEPALFAFGVHFSAEIAIAPPGNGDARAAARHRWRWWRLLGPFGRSSADS